MTGQPLVPAAVVSLAGAVVMVMESLLLFAMLRKNQKKEKENQ